MDDDLHKLTAMLGKEVIIDSPLMEVWKANEMHRKLYGGTLFNILTADTGTVVKTNAPKKVNQPDKSKTDTIATIGEIPKKRKKGFFRKIFGRKNKNNS